IGRLERVQRQQRQQAGIARSGTDEPDTAQREFRKIESGACHGGRDYIAARAEASSSRAVVRVAANTTSARGHTPLAMGPFTFEGEHGIIACGCVLRIQCDGWKSF